MRWNESWYITSSGPSGHLPRPFCPLRGYFPRRGNHPLKGGLFSEIVGPVLDRLGDVLGLDRLAAREVGDRARHAQDAVVAAG